MLKTLILPDFQRGSPIWHSVRAVRVKPFVYSQPMVGAANFLRPRSSLLKE